MTTVICPHCKNDDARMIEMVLTIPQLHVFKYYCINCSKEFTIVMEVEKVKT